MKAKRADKLELKLSAAEDTLEKLLDKLLPGAIERDSLLFMNSEFNPIGLQPYHLLCGEELLANAKECIQLREQLGLPLEDSAAYLYLTACKESASKNEHRRGPRGLAEWLLSELSNIKVRRVQ